MSTVPLGPFELDELLGLGGMGEVWRGRHRALGLPVAVKVMTSAHARRPEYLATFRAEVRAVAGLLHPGIVAVHEHGEVDAGAQAASEGRLVAGSPYLAMDLLEGGSLEDRLRGPEAPSWTEQRAALLDLLDALAHAHAHGIVHRDIKPANVLLSGPPGPTTRLRLTDFGLAHAGDGGTRAGFTEVASGTPQYMAPEQFEGHWRDFGPWTDLYALGCVAFQLATGRQAFDAPGIFALAWAHVHGKRSPFEPRRPVPEGFEGWLERLLRRRPADRFQRASDAAWALRALPPVEDPDPTWPTAARVPPRTDPETPTVTALDLERAAAAAAAPSAEELGSLQTLVRAAPVSWKGVPSSGLAETLPARPPVPLPSDPVARSRADLPPMPATWRRPPDPRPDRRPLLRLPGAGLGLFGLRAVPFVGREQERDLLWAALAEVRRTARARVAVLRGASGAGKSRLAEWTARRADEVGAAQVLRVRHSPTPTAGDGLDATLARFFACRGLTPTEVRERVDALLAEGALAGHPADEYERQALTELLHPHIEGVVEERASEFAFGSEAERHALARRVLGRLAAARPVLLWIDDAHDGAESLRFVRALLDAQDRTPTPILVVLTVRDDLLPERQDEAVRLGALLGRPEARALHLPPLPPEEHRRLVRALLSLDEELAGRVAARTDGNPLFAVQLVGDWVERGVLVPTAEGFVVRRGEGARLPDEIHEVWGSRLRVALASLPGDPTAALRVAAALGKDVEPREWQAACAALGRPVPPGLAEGLLAAGLALPRREGELRLSQAPTDPGRERRGPAWSFVHAMLRESVLRDAEDAGELPRVHEACARMIEELLPEGAPERSERSAAHLRAAGRHEEAVEPLVEAAYQRLLRSEFAAAHGLLDRAEESVRKGGVPESDPRVGRLGYTRAAVLRHQVRLDEALAVAETNLARARVSGNRHDEAEALSDIADVAHRMHRIEGAQQVLDQAEALFLDLEDESRVYRCRRVRASLHRVANRPDLALALLEEILAFFDRRDEPVQRANTLRDLAIVLRQVGRLDRAEALTREALQVYRDMRSPMGAVRCLNTLGTIAMSQGRREQAVRLFREGLEEDQRIGSGLGSMFAINLGLAALEAEDHAGVVDVLAPWLPQLRREQDHFMRLVAEAVLLASEVALEPPVDAGERLGALMDEAAGLGLSDEDLALPLERLGLAARDRGLPGLARPALTAAAEQWVRLGKVGRGERLREEVASLPGD